MNYRLLLIEMLIDYCERRGKTKCGKTYKVYTEVINDLKVKSLSAVVDLVNLRWGIAYIDNELNRTARAINYSFGVNKSTSIE